VAGEGTHRGMGSRDGARRARCWQRRQPGATLVTAGDLDELDRPEEVHRPPPSRAKNFLGAAMTLAIVGVIFLQVTNSLASPCLAARKPRPGPGACSGITSLASHIRGIATLCVIGLAALAAAAFIWYMFWGYKSGLAREDRGG
jgi:hypothetical protein